MDFANAKLQINPDPNWWPCRKSAEYQEILCLMKQSGTVQLVDKIPVAVEKDKGHMWKRGQYVNPLNAVVNEVYAPKVSKREFMNLPSNKKKVEEHLYNSIMVEKPARIPITAIPTGISEGKRMTKEEFLKLGQNREFVSQHINYYK